MMASLNISICRVYSPPVQKEGTWILVDRLWPRGLKKDALAFDLWLKEITPSTELRKWFHQDSAVNWLEFERRYIRELQEKPELIEQVREQAAHSPVILFYAAKDPVHNHALVLQKVLLCWPECPDVCS